MSEDAQAEVELDWSEVSTDRLVAGLEIITPRLTADTVALNSIESVDSQVIEINDDVIVHGTLYADKIKAGQIEGLEILTDKISSISADVEANAEESTGQVAGANTDAKSSSSPVGINLDMRNVTFQTATVTLDLNVIGTLTASGGLVVNGDATFNGLVAFNGRTTFDNDTGGFANIQTGQSRVVVLFDKPYDEPPSISLTNKNGNFVDFAYEEIKQDPTDPTNRTVIGFAILLKEPASADLEFAWTAFSIKDAQISQAP
jgi:hypothetical protein